MIQFRSRGLRTRGADALTQFEATGQRIWSSDIEGQEMDVPILQQEREEWGCVMRGGKTDRKLVNGRGREKMQIYSLIGLLCILQTISRLHGGHLH